MKVSGLSFDGNVHKALEYTETVRFHLMEINQVISLNKALASRLTFTYTLI